MGESSADVHARSGAHGGVPVAGQAAAGSVQAVVIAAAEGGPPRHRGDARQ